MTTKDRILCALGFHGKFENTGDKITTIDGGHIVAQVFRCTVCGRLKKQWIY